MPLWYIHPVAHPGDERWQGRKIWKEVLVRAPSAAMARLFACELDRPAQRRRKGNETLCFRSGLEDAKLYWVERLDRCDSISEREGVVRAVLPNGRQVTPAAFEEPYQGLKPPLETIAPPLPRAA